MIDSKPAIKQKQKQKAKKKTKQNKKKKKKTKIKQRKTFLLHCFKYASDGNSETN